MTRAFFHGGPKDGEWVEYHDRSELLEFVEVPHMPEMRVEDCGDTPMDLPVHRSMYLLKVYVHDGRYHRWRYNWQGAL